MPEVLPDIMMVPDLVMGLQQLLFQLLPLFPLRHRTPHLNLHFLGVVNHMSIILFHSFLAIRLLCRN
jgi:hypothetical protein